MVTGGDAKYRLVPYVGPSGNIPVQGFLDDLEINDPEAAEAYFALIEPLVKKYGGALGMPHFKHLPPTEFSEIRWRGKDRGHHRIYCTFEQHGKILLLHAVTKRWPKFDSADQQICRQRYSDYRSTNYDFKKRLSSRE